MYVFSNVAIAFLSNGNHYLLMKRSLNKKYAPGLWDGVGGRLEQEEINNPRAACLREIHEETGIVKNCIDNLRLKYIILQRFKDRIQVLYLYFGNSTIREVIDTDEGELYWVTKDELLNREFTDAIRLVLSHYLEFGMKTDDVLVGTMIHQNNRPLMSWNQLYEVGNPI